MLSLFSNFIQCRYKRLETSTRCKRALAVEDVKEKAVEPVQKLVKVPLTQYQFDAIVHFTFNVGQGSKKKGTGLAASEFLRQLNLGNPNAELMMRFITPKIIIPRRMDEIHLFKTGDYKFHYKPLIK